MNGHHRHGPWIDNAPHQHAFVVVGSRTHFGVHMTQYHTELHKYQLILKLSLTDTDAERLRRVMADHPGETFVLCNDGADENLFSIPEVAGGARETFVANVFHGIPPLPADPGPHFFPWDRDVCDPVIEAAEVRVARVALFRPFAHHEPTPPVASYWLWGEGDEAHMTNLQTARLASGPFEPLAFGPGYDHVMSLAEPPDWLAPDLLRAGVVVSAPGIRLFDPETGAPIAPCASPFRHGEKATVLYRGVGERLSVRAGWDYLWCLDVCNSPEANPCAGGACAITPMPERWLRRAEAAS